MIGDIGAFRIAFLLVLFYIDHILHELLELCQFTKAVLVHKNHVEGSS